MDDSPDLTQLERDVLRTVRIARKDGDVRFLLDGGGWSIEEVRAALDSLAARRFAVRDDLGFWTQTQAGEAALRRADTWELLVEDTFELSGLGTVVKGHLLSGEIYIGDFFLVDGGHLGQILSIEVLPWQESDPSIAFRSDVPLTPGQRLTGCIPEAAAPPE